VRIIVLASALSLLVATLVLVVLGSYAAASPCGVVGGVLAAIWVALWKDWRDNQKH
jgi:hypothetical protein